VTDDEAQLWLVNEKIAGRFTAMLSSTPEAMHGANGWRGIPAARPTAAAID
jgi:hypothetical protein